MHNCFPLLCKLCNKKQLSHIEQYFENPFSVYETEINKVYTDGKYCALALCVIFNNSLKEELLTDDIDKETRVVFKNVFEGCKLNRGSRSNVIQVELDTLLNTFVRKEDYVYKAVQDKIFDFLSYYFSKKNVEMFDTKWE